MKLRETIQFEIAYQARRPVTWLFFAVLAALVFQLTTEAHIEEAKGGGSPVHVPLVLAALTLFGGMMALLPIAAIAGEAAARDVMARITPLTYTAPVTKSTYLGGRFLAALALAALVSAAVPLGILLAVAASGLGSELLGRFRPAYYAGAWAFVGLPNVVVAAAFAFAVAARARRPAAGFIGSALLFVASLLCFMLLALTLGEWRLAALLDPLALTTVLELTQSWTPEQKWTGFPWLASSYLLNRALWLGVAAGVLALTHHRFRFAHHAATVERKRAAVAAPAPAAVQTPVAAPRPRLDFGPGTRARQLAGIAGESYRVVVLGGGGVVMLVLAAMIVAAGPMLLEFNGVPIVPVTAYLATGIGDPGMWPAALAMLLIAYYAGELVWRDREAGLGEIAGAAPVPDGVYLLGRAGGLALAMATLHALAMAAWMLVQLRMGYRALEPWLHLRLFLGLQLADTLLFAALAVVVHVVVAHKYVGYLVMLLVYAFTLFAPLLGVEHRLLVYAADPGWTYSDMRGFGGSVGPWLTLQLYWASWTALLLVGASLMWMRGREEGIAARLRMARRRLTRGPVAAAAAAAALVLALGGFTFYNTNVLNEYRPMRERVARRAEYERRYARYAQTAQPVLDAVRLHADLRPERRAAEIRGTYRLVNRGRAPVDSIHVSTNWDVVTGPIRLDRAASLALSDERHGYRIYALAEPLRPGDTLRLDFTVRIGQRGFGNDGVGELVTAKVAEIRSALLPAIGYQFSREIPGAGLRREHGLPAPRSRSLDNAAARYDVRLAGAEMVAVETVVGTDAEQRAVAPGALRRTWREGGRRWFHYATERPILNDYALFSADYAVRTGRWRDPSASSGQVVGIEVVHHPGHAWNVDGMVAAVGASLEHLSTTLGPYPYRQARLVEYPGTVQTLHAFPINVSYQEGFALLDPSGGARGLDFPFAIVAHEMAHQWWGNQLLSAEVEGEVLLIESLAWYSAMGVVEQARGRQELERLVALMREAWLPPRPPSDPPLLRANDWFLGYRKGPLALYALREYIGAERVNLALRRLFAANAHGRPPLPTSLDLYRELQAVTPDSLRYLLHDLFAENTLWDLQTDSMRAEPAPGGMTRLTLDVRARKVVISTTGVEREVPMNDLVEIGAFAEGTGDEPGAPVYRRLHRIRSGAQRITLTVPATAAWAGIDPRHLLFDLNPMDNVARPE
jgi:hypothetical protein